MSTALRFTHSGTDYDFSDEEVEEIKYYPTVERTDVFWDLFGNATMYIIGDGYKMFEITFRIVNRSAYTNLKALFNLVDSDNNPESLLCYYEYLIDPVSKCMVQMRRDQYEEQYIAGYLKYGYTVTIQFLEKYTVPGLVQNVMTARM